MVAVCLAVTLLSVGCGYEVEELQNSTNNRLSQLENGSETSFANILDVEDCERLEIVRTYTSEADKKAQVGRAKVNTNTDLFVLLVAFDDEDDVLQAIRVSRVPFDLDEIAPYSGRCSDLLVANEGGPKVIRSGP